MRMSRLRRWLLLTALERQDFDNPRVTYQEVMRGYYRWPHNHSHPATGQLQGAITTAVRLLEQAGVVRHVKRGDCLLAGYVLTDEGILFALRLREEAV